MNYLPYLWTWRDGLIESYLFSMILYLSGYQLHINHF